MNTNNTEQKLPDGEHTRSGKSPGGVPHWLSVLLILGLASACQSITETLPEPGEWPVLKHYDKDHVDRIALPLGGIAYPDMANPNADWIGYYAAATDLLNATSPDAFSPSINQLDLLIQSMQLVP